VFLAINHVVGRTNETKDVIETETTNPAGRKKEAVIKIERKAGRLIKVERKTSQGRERTIGLERERRTHREARIESMHRITISVPETARRDHITMNIGKKGATTVVVSLRLRERGIMQKIPRPRVAACHFKVAETPQRAFHQQSNFLPHPQDVLMPSMSVMLKVTSESDRETPRGADLKMAALHNAIPALRTKTVTVLPLQQNQHAVTCEASRL
jgi:hypothetical protein